MRTFDATFLNELANRPSIRPFLGGDGPIDITNHINDHHNYALVDGAHGGWFAHRRMNTIYEVHTIFEPCGFKDVMKFARAAILYMFAATDCVELVSVVPHNNRGAKALAVKSGFTTRDTIGQWKLGVGADVMCLHLDAWARTCYSSLLLGRAFHNQFDGAKRARGKQLIALSGENPHLHILGAMLQLASAGNVIKGADLYNRWSLFQGGPSVAPLSVVPPLIDMVDGVIGVDDNEWRVMLCR